MPVNTQVSCVYANQKVIPCPLLSFERAFDRSADGTVRRKYWTVTLSGFIVATMGSPNSAGTFWSGGGYPPDEPGLTANLLFDSLKTKIGALANLFSIANEGKWLEFQPPNGGVPIRCQPKWQKLSYPQGNWYNKLEWSITGETDFILPFDNNATAAETPAEEQWSLDRTDAEGRIFKLSHSVSYTGRKRYDGAGNVSQQGWEVAKDIVVAKLGFDTTQAIASAVLDLNGVSPFDYIRGEQVDMAGGKFTVNESWTIVFDSDLPTGLTGGKVIEEFTVDNSYGAENGLTNVRLNGSIKGLEERNPVTYQFIRSRYDNAVLRAAGLTTAFAKALAQSVSGVTLNPVPLSLTTSRNKISGVITYSASFDNRIGSSDAANISEVVTIEFDNAASVVGQIGIPFRAAGPILQDIGTVGPQTITVSVEIVRPVIFGQIPTIPTYNTLAKALQYLPYVPNQLFMIRDTPRYVEQTGRFSRSTTFLYQ